jgi:hypothetical protein
MIARKQKLKLSNGNIRRTQAATKQRRNQVTLALKAASFVNKHHNPAYGCTKQNAVRCQPEANS